MSSKRVTEESSQTVLPRQWLRLVVAYLMIPLTLFICSGDINWWAAWLYSMLFLGAGIGGRMWAEQRHPGLTGERQNIENFENAKHWDKVLAPLMALSVGPLIAVAAGLDHRFNWSPEFPLWLMVIGFTLVSFGYALAAWAFAENRFFFSVVLIKLDRGHVVCDSGPYRIVRHPGYCGSILAVCGIPLALGSVWTLMPAVFASVIALIRTALEDQALHDELPGYRDYVRRVRYRLIPGVF